MTQANGNATGSETGGGDAAAPTMTPLVDHTRTLLLKGVDSVDDGWEDEVTTTLKEMFTLNDKAIESLTTVADSAEATPDIYILFSSRLVKQRVYSQRDKLEAPLELQAVADPNAAVDTGKDKPTDEVAVVDGEEGGDEGAQPKAADVEVVEEPAPVDPVREARDKDEEEFQKFDVDKCPIVWEGAPEFQWRNCSTVEEKRRLIVENVMATDLMNPFVYAAMQRALSVEFVGVTPPTYADRRNGMPAEHNVLRKSKLTLVYSSDTMAMRAATYFLVFVRSAKGQPAHKRLKVMLPQTPATTKMRENLEKRLGRVMPELMAPLRSLMLRDVPESATEENVRRALKLDADAQVTVEFREDMKKRRCALVTFDTTAIDACVRTHAFHDEVGVWAAPPVTVDLADDDAKDANAAETTPAATDAPAGDADKPMETNAVAGDVDDKPAVNGVRGDSVGGKTESTKDGSGARENESAEDEIERKMAEMVNGDKSEAAEEKTDPAPKAADAAADTAAADAPAAETGDAKKEEAGADAADAKTSPATKAAGKAEKPKKCKVFYMGGDIGWWTLMSRNELNDMTRPAKTNAGRNRNRNTAKQAAGSPTKRAAASPRQQQPPTKMGRRDDSRSRSSAATPRGSIKSTQQYSGRPTGGGGGRDFRPRPGGPGGSRGGGWNSGGGGGGARGSWGMQSMGGNTGGWGADVEMEARAARQQNMMGSMGSPMMGGYGGAPGGYGGGGYGGDMPYNQQSGYGQAQQGTRGYSAFLSGGGAFGGGGGGYGGGGARQNFGGGGNYYRR